MVLKSLHQHSRIKLQVRVGKHKPHIQLPFKSQARRPGFGTHIVIPPMRLGFAFTVREKRHSG